MRAPAAPPAEGTWVEVDDPELALDDVPTSREVAPRRVLALLVLVLAVGIAVGFALDRLGLEGPALVLATGAKLASAAVALTVATRAGWVARVGFVRPRVPRRLWLAWLPGAYLLLVLAGGMPSRSWGQVLGVVGLCFAIGLEEELWTRGLLLESLRDRGTTAAVWWSSIAFGLLHGVNAIGGQPPSTTAVQVGVATLFGLSLGALRVRTGTLWLPILVHAAWDVAVILRTGELGAGEGVAWQQAVAALALFVPLGIHGAVLARRSKVPGPDGRMPRARALVPPWRWPAPVDAPGPASDALGRWPAAPPELLEAWTRHRSA